jgi:hypothetical protein
MSDRAVFGSMAATRPSLLKVPLLMAGRTYTYSWRQRHARLTGGDRHGEKADPDCYRVPRNILGDKPHARLRLANGHEEHIKCSSSV